MKLLQGLVLVAVIAVLSSALNSLYPPVSAVLIALILGFAVRCGAGNRREFQPGAQYALKSLLKLAIVFLGVRLSFTDFVNLGFKTLLIIMVCITVALIMTKLIARKFHVPPRLGTLIAVGTAICGNSAVVATAGAIDAEEGEVACAVGTITLFGVLAIIVYPFLGTLLGVPDFLFGVWSGTAINDTAQVVSAGFIYSEAAGEIATAVKLTRNLFIAPVVFLFSVLYTMDCKKADRNVNYGKIFPWFVLGFIAMAFMRTWGLLPPIIIRVLQEASSFLILMAIAGIGLSFDFETIKKMGLKSLYIGLFAASVMGLVSFLLVNGFL